MERVGENLTHESITCRVSSIMLILSSITILGNSPPPPPLPLSLSLPDQLSGGGDLNGVVIIEEEGAWLARARREVESQAKKMLMQGLELMVSSPHPQISPQTPPTNYTNHTHKSHLRPHPLITQTTPPISPQTTPMSLASDYTH